MHRSQAAAGDAGRLSPPVRSHSADVGRCWPMGRMCMACKRSGVRIPVAPLPSSRQLIRTVAARRPSCLARVSGRPLRCVQLQISRSQWVRALPWIGHLTSCIAGKRPPIELLIHAGQKALSKGGHAGEQHGEQNNRTASRARARTSRVGKSGSDPNSYQLGYARSHPRSRPSALDRCLTGRARSPDVVTIRLVRQAAAGAR
jgi:hypothetical protein